MALHVDYEVRWQNFKGFVDTGWIKIKPITIILGTNNSGKTSFLSPLLLMNQTLLSRDSVSPFVTRGEIIDSGSIRDIFPDYNIKKDITFGFKYHTHEPDEETETVGSYAPGAVQFTLGTRKKGSELLMKSQIIYDIFNREYIKIERDRYGKFHVSGIDNNKLDDNEKKSIEISTPLNFLFSPNTFLFNIEVKEEDEKSESGKQFSEEFSDLLRAVSYNYSQCRRILTELSFIGPLRDYPRRYYELTGEFYNTVGPRGENMPSLLEKKYTKIKDQLDEWISRFGFGEKLLLNTLHENLISIDFQEKNKLTSIANVGFGASQILPLIVQALVSSKSSLTIAEQPEIHLNPKLQSVLADLFAFMANNDKRVIVETHSEHLLLRLRRLVADQTLSTDDLAIYFIEKENGKSVIKEINIQNNGHIKPNDWPKGFFEDSLKESLSLAKEQAKRK